MLDDCKSLTDSVTSTDVENSDVGSDSDFDLSDPEALAENDTCADVAPRNEMQETNEFDFVSDNCGTFSSFNSESIVSGQTVSVDDEDHIHASGASLVRRLSWSGRRTRGRNARCRGYRPRTTRRGRSGSRQSVGRERGQSCARAGVQSQRRSRGARNRSGRSRG